LILNKIWLNDFKYGPFEWIWSNLSYKRIFIPKNKDKSIKQKNLILFINKTF